MIQADLQEKLLTDESMLEAVLLEVLRLYPPFIGGRRVISQVIVFMVFSLYSEIYSSSIQTTLHLHTIKVTVIYIYDDTL